MPLVPDLTRQIARASVAENLNLRLDELCNASALRELPWLCQPWPICIVIKAPQRTPVHQRPLDRKHDYPLAHVAPRQPRSGYARCIGYYSRRRKLLMLCVPIFLFSHLRLGVHVNLGIDCDPSGCSHLHCVGLCRHAIWRSPLHLDVGNWCWISYALTDTRFQYLGYVLASQNWRIFYRGISVSSSRCEHKPHRFKKIIAWVELTAIYLPSYSVSSL